tara:strand:- start:185 stop:373 length:189 start_codon:yes stop_codon:yes gene_type:complete
MPATSVTKSKPISSKRKSLSVKTQKGSSVQPQFTSSKLIQNLGSRSEQYKNLGKLRNAWGRD